MDCLNGILGFLMKNEITFRFGKKYSSQNEYFADIERINNRLKELHNCAILGFEPNFTIVNLATNETQNIPHWLLMKMIGEYVAPEKPKDKQTYQYKDKNGNEIPIDLSDYEFEYYSKAIENLRKIDD